MKNKKLVIYIILSALLAVFLSSCAIDRKCPAYSQAAETSVLQRA